MAIKELRKLHEIKYVPQSLIVTKILIPRPKDVQIIETYTVIDEICDLERRGLIIAKPDNKHEYKLSKHFGEWLPDG